MGVGSVPELDSAAVCRDTYGFAFQWYLHEMLKCGMGVVNIRADA
jgi:hypothetical protein